MLWYVFYFLKSELRRKGDMELETVVKIIIASAVILIAIAVSYYAYKQGVLRLEKIG